MVRLLISAAIFLVTAALGLLAAAWVLDDVELALSGFITATVIFAVAQAIFTPFVLSVARRHAPKMLGGIGLVSTLVALVIASTFTDGLTISGATTWVLASLIVWAATALGAWLLPLLVLKNRHRGRDTSRTAPRN